MSGEETSGRAPLVVRPSPRRLAIRIAFLALFAVFAWLLIRLDWPRLALAAVLFVGVPMAFILDALITFRVRLCLDADGISHTGKFGRWHRRWQDLAAWTHREFRGFNDPVAVVIRLHPESGGPPLRISSALVFYKDHSYRAVYEGLTRHLGPPAPEFMVGEAGRSPRMTGPAGARVPGEVSTGRAAGRRVGAPAGRAGCP